MSRNVPSPPHPDQSLVNDAFRITREWFDWVSTFAKAAIFNTPLTGTATFVAATSVAVTFTNAEPSANYNVSIDSPANRTHWITSKATTGFTINASASNSDTVGWTIFRR